MSRNHVNGMVCFCEGFWRRVRRSEWRCLRVQRTVRWLRKGGGKARKFEPTSRIKPTPANLLNGQNGQITCPQPACNFYLRAHSYFNINLSSLATVHFDAGEESPLSYRPMRCAHCRPNANVSRQPRQLRDTRAITHATSSTAPCAPSILAADNHDWPAGMSQGWVQVSTVPVAVYPKSKSQNDVLQPYRPTHAYHRPRCPSDPWSRAAVWQDR